MKVATDQWWFAALTQSGEVWGPALTCVECWATVKLTKFSQPWFVFNCHLGLRL